MLYCYPRILKGVSSHNHSGDQCGFHFNTDVDSSCKKALQKSGGSGSNAYDFTLSLAISHRYCIVDVSALVFWFGGGLNLCRGNGIGIVTFVSLFPVYGAPVASVFVSCTLQLVLSVDASGGFTVSVDVE